MMLSDVRDLIATFGITENVYSGKLDAKQRQSIGVYNSKHQHTYATAIGGPALKSHGTKYVTLLVHWNDSQREAEKACMELFERVRSIREMQINETKVKFILPLYDPQDIGTDDAGIYEWVIELAIVYEKGV